MDRRGRSPSGGASCDNISLIRRLLASCSLLALASFTALSYLRFERERASLVELVRDSGLADAQPDLQRLVATDHDLTRARLRIAQGLLDSVSRPGWLSEVSRSDRAEALAGAELSLNRAREIATRALREQPASWRAALILGGSAILSREPEDLLGDRESWEASLRAAQSLARQESAPSRYLAFAHFGLWPYVDAAEHERILLDLRRAFTDRRSFDLMIDFWLDRLENREQLLSVLPDETWAWERVQARWASERDWDAVVLARRRWRDARTVATRDRLEDALARREGGDLRGARDGFRSAAAGLAVDVENLDFLFQILAQAPPGALTQATQPALRRWLDLLLDLCYLGHCHASPEMLERLLRNAGDVEPPVAALAQLLAGDLPAAEAIERRSSDTWSEPWGRYLVLHAEALLERDEQDEARQALLRVASAWQGSARFWQAKVRLAKDTEDADGAIRAQEMLSRLQRFEWQAEDWRTAGRGWELDLWSDAPSSKAAIAWSGEAGAVVETSWDGILLETFAVDPSRSETVLSTAGTAPATRGPSSHRLRVEVIAGKTAPASFRLLGAGLVS